MADDAEAKAAKKEMAKLKHDAAKLRRDIAVAAERLDAAVRALHAEQPAEPIGGADHHPRSAGRLGDDGPRARHGAAVPAFSLVDAAMFRLA
jgi:hypothetical protein